MRLNKSTSHAIRILIDCAEAGDDLVKVADLSARLGITMQNVFKIVHILSRADLITAMRGRYGGVRLARSPRDVRVGDIVRAMESTALELEAGERRSDLLVARGVNVVLDSALEAFIAILDRHTLTDIAADAKGKAAERADLASKLAGATRRPMARPRRATTSKAPS